MIKLTLTLALCAASASADTTPLTILDSNLNIIPFSQTVPTPNRRTEFSPRIDYQINSKNTLVARYEFEHSTNVAGVGGFSLASRQYNTSSTEHNIRLTETAILNKTTVNETRFQFVHHQPLARPDVEDLLAAYLTDHSEKRDVAHLLVGLEWFNQIISRDLLVTPPVPLTQHNFAFST